MQQSLRLISLSNYVFVLEISQISGIVQNVSMLIMAVMRIVAVVGGGKERERRSVAGTHSPPWSRSFTLKDFETSPGNSRGKRRFRLPPTHDLPRLLCFLSRGAPIGRVPQKVPFESSFLMHQLQMFPSTECLT